MRESDGSKPPDSFLDKQGGGQGGNNGGSGSNGNSGSGPRINAGGRGGKDNGRDSNRNGGRGGDKRDNSNRNNNDHRGGSDNKGGKPQFGSNNFGNGNGMRGANPEDRRGGDKGGDKSLLGKRKDKDEYSSAPSAAKVFVGGLDYGLTEDDFRRHFETKFGPVKAAQIVRDANSGQSKGFGFVTF